MSGFDAIYSAFLRGAGKWKGCDWSTTIGSIRLNPDGMTAAQAFQAARTTEGRESAEWETADAQQAEDRARQALQQALGGRLMDALISVQQACAVEARYPRKSVWQPLLTAITVALIDQSGLVLQQRLPVHTVNEITAGRNGHSVR
jgi:hypothetical protein